MASLALIPIIAAAGAPTTLAGTVAVGALTVAAAFIDSTYIYPYLDRQSNQGTGPKLDDRSVQTASEGSPMLRIVGNGIRVAGTLIYASDLIETKVRQNVSGGKGGSDDHTSHFEYYVHLAIGICEGPIEGVDKIWADAKLVYDSSVTPPNDPRAHRVRIKLGTGSQNPDSILEGLLGSDQVPGFRDTAYVVIEAFALRDWGNRVPQFMFQVRTKEVQTVAEGIDYFMDNAGFAVDEYDTTNVDMAVRGYAVSGITPTLQAIEPLLRAYDVLTQESNSTLTFFSRGREQEMTIDSDDLVAHEGIQQSSDGSESRPFMITDPSGFDLPKEVNIRFLDASIDFQAGSQRFTRNDVSSTQIISLDLPIVLSPKEARDIAAKRLWRYYSERLEFKWTLPPSYLRLQENDIAVIPWDGEIYNIRVMEVTMGMNGLLECRGVLTGMESADEAVECGPHLIEADPVVVPANNAPLLAAILDTSAVRDEDTQTPGIYYALTSLFVNPYVSSASIYTSSDNGVNWDAVDATEPTSDMGVAQTGLADGERGYIDSKNTVTVFMYSGELVSVTKDQLIGGSNRMWIGKELLAYQTATLTASKTYVLSDLIRGLRTTPMVGHAANERCVVVSPDSVGFIKMNASVIGKERLIKFLQTGQAFEDVPTYYLKFEGGTLKQLPPFNVKMVRDPSTGDIAVTWIRRTRALTQVYSPYKPLLAESEQYILEFYEVSSSTLTKTILRRTQTVNAATTYTYTYADRSGVDGFLGFSSRVIVVIYQIGQPVGRGYPAELLLP